MTFHIQIVTVPNTMFRGEAFGSWRLGSNQWIEPLMDS
jgi:hypothetical protein